LDSKWKDSFPKNEEVVLTKQVRPLLAPEIENEVGDLFTERTSQLVENTSGKKIGTATPQLQQTLKVILSVIFYKMELLKLCSIRK
jgi:hypothetical protein